MGDKFSYSVLEQVVAKICVTIGYSRVQLTALEVLTGVLIEFLTKMGKGAYMYAELAGRTQPMIKDFELVFKNMNINIEEMKTYIEYVDEIPSPVAVPKYPVKKENHLNFLKPGSKEVITRPLHIHEYMPAQFPELENQPVIPVKDPEKKSEDTKKNPRRKLLPSRASKCNSTCCKFCNSTFKKSSSKRKNVGHPLRHINSILMTRSGYLSSSVEGKLPESKLVSKISNTVTSETSLVPDQYTEKGNSSMAEDVKPNWLVKNEVSWESKVSSPLKALLAAKGLIKEGHSPIAENVKPDFLVKNEVSCESKVSSPLKALLAAKGLIKEGSFSDVQSQLMENKFQCESKSSCVAIGNAKQGKKTEYIFSRTPQIEPKNTVVCASLKLNRKLTRDKMLKDRALENLELIKIRSDLIDSDLKRLNDEYLSAKIPD